MCGEWGLTVRRPEWHRCIGCSAAQMCTREDKRLYRQATCALAYNRNDMSQNKKNSREFSARACRSCFKQHKGSCQHSGHTAEERNDHTTVERMVGCSAKVYSRTQHKITSCEKSHEIEGERKKERKCRSTGPTHRLALRVQCSFG